MTEPTAEQRVQTTALAILATVAVGFVLYWLQGVLVPFVLSLFIALGLSPLIEYSTTKLRLPRWVAVLLTLVFAIAVLTLAGILFVTSARRLAANAPVYQAQVRSLVDAVLARFPLEGFGIDPNEIVRLPLNAISTMAVSITNAIIALVSQGTIVLIFLMFLLLGGPARGEPGGGGTWGEVERRVKRYIVFKFAISAVTGTLVGLILTVLGVDLAMAFGLMAFLLNFIPSVGSIISTLLPLPVVLVSPELGLPTAILAIALPGAVQLAMGNVIEPKVMGDELDLHPVTILLALMIWGTVWGVVGMLLATPITAVLKIYFERGGRTKAIAELFAGRIDALRRA